MRFYIAFSLIVFLLHIVLFLNGENLVFNLDIGSIVGLAVSLLIPVVIIGLNIFSGDFSKRFLQAVYYLVFHFYILIPIRFSIPLGLFEITVDRSIQLGLGFTQKLIEYFNHPLNIFLPILVIIGFVSLILSWGEA
jgi:hypothetical protein